MVASVSPRAGKVGGNVPPYLVAKVMKIEDKEGLLEQVEEAMITKKLAELCPGFKGGCEGVDVHEDEAGRHLVALYRRALMDGDRLFAVLRRHPRFPEIVVGCSRAHMDSGLCGSVELQSKFAATEHSKSQHSSFCALRSALWQVQQPILQAGSDSEM
jgi:hypothetical protein